jgi:hypothetical protein
VATIDASGSAQFAGSLIASGSGTFRKIQIADAIHDASGSAQLDSTAGTAILPTGATAISITNSLVTPHSLIYVTPITSTKNQVIYVKEKIERIGFTVGLDIPITTDITFNWWIIN